MQREIFIFINQHKSRSSISTVKSWILQLTYELASVNEKYESFRNIADLNFSSSYTEYFEWKKCTYSIVRNKLKFFGYQHAVWQVTRNSHVRLAKKALIRHERKWRKEKSLCKHSQKAKAESSAVQPNFHLLLSLDGKR